MTRNSIYLTLEKASHIGFGMVLVVAVARILGPEGLGGYAFVIGLSSLFVPLMDLGLNNRTILRVAEGGTAAVQAMTEAVGFKILVAPPALVVMGLAGWALGKSPQVLAALLLVGASAVFMGLGDAFNAVFKGMRRPVYGMWLVAGLNLILCASGIWTMAAGKGLMGLAVCFFLSRAVYLAAAALLLRKVGGALRPQLLGGFRGGGWGFLVDGLKYLPAVFFCGHLLNLNFLTLYAALPESQAGQYAVGYRVAIALLVLLSASTEAVLPELAVREKKMDALRWTARIAIVSTVVACALHVLAEPSALALFGSAYEASIPSVRWLGWTIPGLAACALLHSMLLAAGRAREAVWTMSGLLIAGSLSGACALALWGTFGLAVVPALVGPVFALFMLFRLRAVYRCEVPI